ncbi:hypothetical protein PHYSODRAFT_315620 [Phytophthora sojae]|uniref:Uncharacterized protein n=1 Tax=Phytophthora sojae (strain P6497) TaxID=1094619 RepID=G4ZP75_PHYSP|nr:hypothetical protein PHYSODRAFT_315620 [Phytophthora sojae]EGZ15115.1 hypothetical protein PHYSODRAFT_315620 [Phytophthora sojae]|eukprot:XP_009528864.1 hypothetical protein PHYSODRAFT_315620 [Phytophthora sojae]
MPVYTRDTALTTPLFNIPTSVRVAVKIGEITKTSRTNVPVEKPVFSFDEREHGHSDVCKQVEDRVAASLSSYGQKTIRSDPSIYMKLSQGAPQRNWVSVSEGTFGSLVATSFSNYQRRTTNTGPFEIEVVLAARKPISNLAGTRRATAPRILEAARTIDSFLEQRSDLQVGEIARTHWSFSDARQPEGTELTVPETATFAQAQHIDAIVMPLTIEVAELRRVLGLPSHNLLASGVFSSFEPPAEPEEDVSDDEHKSD